MLLLTFILQTLIVSNTGFTCIGQSQLEPWGAEKMYVKMVNLNVMEWLLLLLLLLLLLIFYAKNGVVIILDLVNG